MDTPSRVLVPSKRKQDPDLGPADGAASGKRKKPEHVVNGEFVKLDVGKRSVVLKQDPQPLDRYTAYLALMARFQEWLMEQPLEKEVAEIPREFWPLVGMIGHESSAFAKSKLAECVGAALKPTEVADGDVAKISQAALTDVVGRVFSQTSYGIHPADVDAEDAGAAGAVKVPAALALKRWEVMDWEMIPQSGAGRGFKARDVMQERKRFREQAREEVRTMVRALEGDGWRQLMGLDKEERKACGKVDVKGKSVAKEEDGVESGTNILQAKPGKAREKVENGTTILQAKPGKAKPELTPEQLAEKEAKDEEKRAREQERLRKLEAKNKKAQEVAKSKAMMQSFFQKPKVASTSAATTVQVTQEPVARAESRSESVEVELITSNFHTSFKPFYAKANVEVAPVNRFAARHATAVENVSAWQVKDLLADFVRRARKTTRPVERPQLPRKRSIVEESRSGLVRKPKTETLFCTIPDLVDRAQEAEDPRLVYSHLKDYTKFPRKTLKFEEDLRPPYSGTWTKSSWLVGPRTPFALDPNLDYSVDEGLDWEPENLDEGAMDVEESEPESEDDEDMGSWLASDDELEEEVSVPEDPFVTLDPLGMPAVKPKVRKESRLPPRRFEKLVQFQKGPVWESGLGEIAWKGFETYRICVLNDTPLGGIDPFAWQPPQPTPTPTSTATPQPAASSAPVAPDTTPKSLTPRPIPKANLTAAELGDFLRAIDGSDKTKKALLIDLYTRFKSAGTHASIKAKLDEVASRAMTKGATWTIKSAAWVEAGIVPPAPKA